MDNIRDNYKELVERQSKDYKWELSEHAKDVMISLLMTRDKQWVGGDFVQSVLSNDLGQTIRRADSEMIKCLKEMVIAKDNFYLGNTY